MSWFVVRTKPKQEMRACEHLEFQGFEYYCPWLVRSDHTKEPLFPGYLFIKDQASSQPFSKIRCTRGVLGFVRFGLVTANASDSLIGEIRQREQALQGVSRFQPQQPVRIKSGPFADLEAVYLSQSGQDRSVILLRLLNKNNRIVIDDKLLKSV